MIHDIEEVARCNAGGSKDIVLVKRGNRYAVITHDQEQGQVTAPASGGQGEWHAGWSDKGVEYVANWRAKSTARRQFKQECAEAEEYRSYRGLGRCRCR